MRERETKYWIIVASKDHVTTGVTEGIAQACHGKAAPLQRMQKGDYVIYYSGKLHFTTPEKCQQFTAIGQVADNDVFPFQMSADFCPYRRKIIYFPSIAVSILPLIERLDFIKNKKSWGYPFRFGLLEINQLDFDFISTQMLQKDGSGSGGFSFR